jgi:hypothetical protein
MSQSIEFTYLDSDILGARPSSKFHSISAIDFIPQKKEWHMASDRGQYFIFRNIKSIRDFGLGADTVFTQKTQFWIEALRYDSNRNNFIFSVENEYHPTPANSDTTTYVAITPSLVTSGTSLNYLLPPIPLPFDNKGIEAITLTPDGSIWVAPEAGWDGQAHPDSSIIHFLKFHVSKSGSVSQHQFLYSITRKDCPFSPTENVGGISEILSVDNERILILEKCFDDGPGGARKIKAKLWLATVRGNVLEKYPSPAFDFSSLPFQVDNLEGMAWWPTSSAKRQLLLITDDNANSKQRTQLLLLEEK